MPRNLEDLPQIDLYRWLEGALSQAALTELAGTAGPDDSLTSAEPSTVRPSQPSFVPALKARAGQIAPIPTLRRVVQRVLQDAADSSLRRVELVFSPAWLAAAGAYDQATAFEAVLGASAGVELGGMSIGWMAAIRPEASASELESTLALCAQHRAEGIVGISLRLDEGSTPRDDALRGLSSAKEAGLGLVLETGAGTSAMAVADALETLQADRVVDGSYVLGDPRALSAAKAGRATMLTCLMSRESDDPALPAMIQAGLQVVLTTWAPGLIGTSMASEYRQAATSYGLSRESLKGLAMAAAQSSFMDRGPKRKLERELEAELFGFPVA